MSAMTLILALIVLVGLSLMLIERVVPDQPLPQVPGWWARVILINVLQLAVVVLGGLTWETWFQGASLASLSALPLPAQVAAAYLLITFVFYFWHRARHDVQFLWLTCHQLHHSPSRIETITSFFKHPVELIANGVLICFLNYGILGISIEAGAWTTLVTACAEFFYHMNVRTPHWVGYFLQRPEMHRIHHERGKHYYNFADLPVWDMLFGTYKNPTRFSGPCGFRPEREASFLRMLMFRDVNNPRPNKDSPREGST